MNLKHLKRLHQFQKQFHKQLIMPQLQRGVNYESFKEQLVCEANRAIEEFGDAQHDIKAKFKHLIQVYVHNITQSELQSSYKGDDSSLSIDGCFEQIQDAVEAQPDYSALLSYGNRADNAVAASVVHPVAKLDP